MNLSPELVTAVTATTGVIGLISLIVLLYSSQKSNEFRASASSVKGIVQGEGLFNADHVISILQQFGTDDGRVQALRELVTVHKISEDKADRIYNKIKRGVDIQTLQNDRYQHLQRLTSTTAPFFIIVALLAGGYDLYTHIHPSPQTEVAQSTTPTPSPAVPTPPLPSSASTLDGQYVGTAIATNAGQSPTGGTCPQGRLGQFTLEIANNRATLVVNPNTHLIFSGPVTKEGAVALPGHNDSGAPDTYLTGVIAYGQFNGSTSGLACNAEMHLTRIQR